MRQARTSKRTERSRSSRVENLLHHNRQTGVRVLMQAGVALLVLLLVGFGIVMAPGFTEATVQFFELLGF